jgi:hypothetical protein
MQDAAKSTLIVKGLIMSKDYKYAKKWKEMEEDMAEPVSDVATDVFNFITKRKDREAEDSSKKAEEDAYLDEIKKKRKARYQILKEKYKD